MAGSAPARRRYAAASKVRTPVCTAKFLVSTTIPANSAEASSRVISVFSSKYTNSSVTSSLVDEADGSRYTIIGLGMKSSDRR